MSGLWLSRLWLSVWLCWLGDWLSGWLSRLWLSVWLCWLSGWLSGLWLSGRLNRIGPGCDCLELCHFALLPGEFFEAGLLALWCVGWNVG